MFLGHIGLAFAAKKITPTVSLGTLIAATTFVDLLWPMFLLLDLEHVRIAPGITEVTPLDFYHYPITHSLFGAMCWGVVFAMFMMVRKHSVKTAVIIGALVVSHWFLDLLVHRPDLTLIGEEGPGYGFALWNSFAGTLIAEGVVFFGGILIYLKQTKATSKAGTFGLVGFVSLLVAIYVASVFGPPPPNSTAIGIAGLSMWLFVIAAWWIDSKRTSSL